MISDKERQIKDSLNNKEYRDSIAIEHVNTTLAIQIRKMRESRKWNQNDLASHLGKHQETISQWENPDYGRYSISTLKKLAAIFDVALLVKFVPFGELVKDMVNLTETRLSPSSFSDEQNDGAISVSDASTSIKITKDIDANSLNDFANTVPRTFPCTAATNTKELIYA
jgi:transcriptional regulator with XRE-family HTH domain